MSGIFPRSLNLKFKSRSGLLPSPSHFINSYQRTRTSYDIFYDSRFHNDRHLRFLLVYVLFGSIGESSAKEASGQRPAVEASQPQSLPESAACGGSMMCL